ncbi:MAG: HEAT repeat domain-containing protein [Candidatus Methanoperedens sp.]|nr:HEAT repeat domain-containing protein [Candidatus Methanoperedens sp.]
MKKRHDVEGLLGILDTGDIKECRESIRMLGELRSKKAIVPLVGFLETDDIQIRSNAAWALGEIGHVKAVLPLIGLLNDPIDNVRINAAWSLGRIGDKRALSSLRSAMRNGSTELRKHAREAITRIESTEADKRHGIGEEDEPDFSDIAVPLLTLAVPPDMECNYLSRVEDEASQTDFVNTTQFSRDVLLRDSGNLGTILEDELREIILGLRKESNGPVSIDILFRYKNNNGDNKTSSVWLHVSTKDKNGIGETYKIETIPEVERRESKRRVSDTGKRKTRIKYVKKAKPLEYEIPQDFETHREESTYEDIEEPEEFPEEKVIQGKEIKRQYKKFPVRERHVEPQAYSRDEEEFDETQKPDYLEIQEQPEPEIKTREIKPDIKHVKEPVEPAAKIPEPPKPEVKAREIKPESKPAKEPVQSTVKIPEPPKPEIKAKETRPEPKTEPVREKVTIEKKTEIRSEAKPEIKAEVIPETKPQAMPEFVPPHVEPGTDGKRSVDSAVQLLSDIGMSGMTKAASAVTQLSGEEEEAKHSQLRTLPVDELKDEILSLGDNVVMIGVGLNGKGPSGDVNGEMQIYISKQDALDVANELLCNAPEAYVKEFTDDISSTLKEIANIFGGQYVSAISEYIEVPFLLNVPSFKTGQSSQIAESALKDIGGKVEFVLATHLAFGPNKVGRLIILLDPTSFDTIIKKLF